MKIRKAKLNDFKELYKLGMNTPELRVSASEPFMDKDDFKLRILNKNNVFLVAENDNKLIGFICASAKDADRPLKNKYACLVYIVVLPKYRKHGIATKLYDECIKKLKGLGITHIYSWADADTNAIQKFLVNKGFKTGERCIWMDKKL